MQASVPSHINGNVVAFKMNGRSGSCRTRGGRISESIRNRSGSRPCALT